MRWLLLVVLLAGCVGPSASVVDQDVPEEQAPAGPAGPDVAPTTGAVPSATPEANATTGTAAPPASSPPPAAPVEAHWEDRLEIVLPMHVVLVGFDHAAAGILQDEFADPFGPAQSTLHAEERYDLGAPGLPGGGYHYSDLPMRQAVQVQVHVQDDVASYVAAVTAPGTWDGNAAQAWADARLAAWGLEDTVLPVLVLVHVGDEGHQYAIRWSNGQYEKARVMGGDGRALVMDLSADVDPYTGQREDYMSPLDPDDGGSLVEAVEDAIRFRLLQGPLYSIPTAPCHAVTLVYAVHTAGDQGIASGIRAEEALDAPRLQAAFEALTGETVHVDVVRLDLPQDDPALYALVRGVGNHFPQAQTSYEAQGLTRAWFEENWATYHVGHDGCEPYLSVLTYTDALDLTFAFGIAQYDEGSSRRYSFSAVPEGVRGAYEPGLAGDGFCCADPDVEAFDLVNMLFTHETGHLLGMMHPHNVIDDDENEVVWTFSTTRTVMSYLVDEKDTSFGTLDQENWDRNRLAYMARALEDAELKDEAIAGGFLDLVRAGDLEGANRLAQGLLA